MGQEAEEGGDCVEVDQVRVELRPAREDFELLDFLVEVDFGVGELLGLGRVLEAGLDVVLEAALEGEDELF